MKIYPVETNKPFKSLNKNSFQGSPKTFLMNKPKVSDHLEALNNYGKYLAFRGKTESIKPMEDHIKTDVGAKLSALRQLMKDSNLDGLIVRSTDEYLNETVDKNQSQRIYISDFTGSAGDIIITDNKAILMVDSRYHTQAPKEVNPKYYNVEKIGLDKKGNPLAKSEYSYQRMLKVLKRLSKDQPITVGFDPAKFSVSLYKLLESKIKEQGIKVKLVPTESNLIDEVRGGKPPSKIAPVKQIPVELVGETTESKLSRLKEELDKENTDIIILSDLFDIAYLSNLRGADIDYNASIKARGFVADNKLYIFCDPSKVSEEIVESLKDNVIFKPEEAFLDTLEKVACSFDKKPVIAYSKGATNYQTYMKLQELAEKDIEIKELSKNPVAQMRAIKNPVELASMKDGMNRADRAVADVIEYINEKIRKGEKISEKDLENKTREAHLNHGAYALSFEVIPGSGPNGAIVHYSNGDPNKIIIPGELILLDTGGYYAAGYATDLTRSWLAGGEFGVKKLEEKDQDDLKKKREIYTAVLKGALRGAMAELPPGANGQYLDKITREPIKKLGYDFGHSVGHGVGIGVHESPPNITSGESGENKLKEGMVFSVEPGIYIEDWGGVRFENLVTVRKHHDPEKASKGWHEIECLTFAPIDHNLIDYSLLDEEDIKRINVFDKNVSITMKDIKPDEKGLE
ncbi:MAG: M24 family metallopeptidase [Cyanobacteriota bacterium]